MRPLTDEEFDRLFTEFEHTAYRLETRDSYAGVSCATTPFTTFRSGVLPDMGWMAPWLDGVRAARAAGKRFKRVRVVTEPHTAYAEYSMWSSAFNVEAGEDIRYLPRHAATSLPDHDYWLFDSRLLVVMRYDEHDDFVSAERVTDPAVVVEHCAWRDAAWRLATPRADYLKGASGQQRRAGA